MDDSHQETPETARPLRRGVAKTSPSALGLALVVLAAGAFGLYEITRSAGKQVGHSGACARSLDAAAAVDPLVHGEVAALSLAGSANQLGPITFDDAGGNRTSVAAFAGKTILLNLWATWCAPCRAEMPSLDKLQAQLGSAHFAVVPVNIDTTRLDKARAFFGDIGATSLPYYADKTAGILQSLGRKEKVFGLPTSVLIGADGCEIGIMAGPANWDSPDAKALIETLARTDPART